MDYPLPIRTIVALAAAGLFLQSPAIADEAPGGWAFSVMPYLWLPHVDGKLNYGPPPFGGGSANVVMDTGGALDNLKMAAMIAGDARYGRWSIVTDFIHLDFANTASKVQSVDFNPGSGRVNIATSQLNAGTDSSLSGSLWTLAGGYAVLQEPNARVELLAGFRYLGIKASSDWHLAADVTGPLGTRTFSRTGNVDCSDSIVTALVGARGRVKLGDSPWFVPFYADLGAGDSTTTWQAGAGIGYAFNFGDIRLDYRHLAYDQSSDKLLQGVSFGGFGLGANFRF